MNKFEALQPMFETDLKEKQKEISPELWEWSHGELGINAVFGISHTALPARFLAGFVPAMALTSAFESVKKPVQVNPELRIFVPLHLAQACGVPEAQSQETLNQGVLLIQKFQETFHPQIRWFLDIDNPMEQKHIDRLVSLTDEVLRVFHDEDVFDEEWKKIQKAAERRGIPHTAKMYAPHGVFGWQDFFDIRDPKFFQMQPMFITVNVMSTAEEPFRMFHQAMKTHFASEKIVRGDFEVTHMDLFTKLCRRPHYLLADIGSHQEPTLSDLLLLGFEKTRQELESMRALSDKFRQASRDLGLINTHIEALRKDDAKLPNVEEFIQDVKLAFENRN